MFEVAVTAQFSAAHALRDYNGPCERLHGHNYTVEVAIRGGELDERGLLIDFRDVKALLADVIDELDHQLLNDLEAFADVSPTSEVIARHIYNRLAASVAQKGLRLAYVTVWETQRSRATYLPHDQ